MTSGEEGTIELEGDDIITGEEGSVFASSGREFGHVADGAFEIGGSADRPESGIGQGVRDQIEAAKILVFAGEIEKARAAFDGVNINPPAAYWIKWAQWHAQDFLKRAESLSMQQRISAMQQIIAAFNFANDEGSLENLARKLTDGNMPEIAVMVLKAIDEWRLPEDFIEGMRRDVRKLDIIDAWA